MFFHMFPLFVLDNQAHVCLYDVIEIRQHYAILMKPVIAITSIFNVLQRFVECNEIYFVRYFALSSKYFVLNGS